ncbi:MAG: diguanylate cyclase [Lachnospiraceae bacterium]|nr:diguanylate cyclase [Lachnospiraceae bacterium]
MSEKNGKRPKKVGFLKEQIEAWNVFLESFGNLLPGGIGIYECSDIVRPLYLSQGVIQLCYDFPEDFFKQPEKSVEALLEQKDYQKLRQEIENFSTHGKVLDCTLNYRMAPKKKGWIWVRGKALAKSGKRIIFIVLILDVTKQQEIENELRIQHERYRILEETANEILFEVKIAEDVMTYSYKEIDGELIRRRVPHYSRMLAENPLVHPDYLDIFRQHLTLATRKKTEGTLEYLSKISGRGFEWHRLYYSSIEDESGNVSRIVGRIRNIHDEVLKRQQKEDELILGLDSNSAIQQRIRDSLEDSDLEDRHSVVIVSINNFKRTIEQNGVAWGDAAMHRVVDIIKQIIETKGTFGRLADGKVLLYFKNLPVEELDEIVEIIIQQIEMTDNKVADLNLTCSVGAVAVEGIADYTVLYQEAEEALHLAKITKGERYIRV